MISNFTIIVAGFMAGALHVFMGPDHLAAVAPLALAQKEKSWRLGVRWGLGHATGVILVAALAYMFREIIAVEHLSAKCESLVGVMLIGIGIWGIRKAIKGTKSQPHTHTAIAVGVLHGLAGASHFMGVLPAIAMPTREAAVIYLLFFGVGTVAAMAGFAFIFGTFGSRAESFSQNFFKKAMMFCSFATIIVGTYWLWI